MFIACVQIQHLVSTCSLVATSKQMCILVEYYATCSSRVHTLFAALKQDINKNFEFEKGSRDHNKK